ncbi:hypothetical protein C8R45DRAFT_934331 [Mycena sanguinolenta]|nr:hypothetical protein C8R45DRAFT_934331 [Mycena sanguinolenta]
MSESVLVGEPQTEMDSESAVKNIPEINNDHGIEASAHTLLFLCPTDTVLRMRTRVLQRTTRVLSSPAFAHAYASSSASASHTSSFAQGQARGVEDGERVPQVWKQRGPSIFERGRGVEKGSPTSAIALLGTMILGRMTRRKCRARGEGAENGRHARQGCWAGASVERTGLRVLQNPHLCRGTELVLRDLDPVKVTRRVRRKLGVSRRVEGKTGRELDDGSGTMRLQQCAMDGRLLVNRDGPDTGGSSSPRPCSRESCACWTSTNGEELELRPVMMVKQRREWCTDHRSNRKRYAFQARIYDGEGRVCTAAQSTLIEAQPPRGSRASSP